MDAPGEDIPDCLSRRRKLRTEITRDEALRTSDNYRKTDAISAHCSFVPGTGPSIACHAETACHASERTTLTARSILPRQPPLACDDRVSVGSKRPHEAHLCDTKTSKRPRTEGEATNGTAELTSQALPHRSSVVGIVSTRASSSGSSSDHGVNAGHLSPQGNDVLPLNERIPSDILPPPVIAELSVGDKKTAYARGSRRDATSTVRASASSEAGLPTHYVSSVEPRHTKQCASEPELPGAAASRASSISPPPTFNCCSTVAACSEITSPPNSAPPAHSAVISASTSPSKRPSVAAGRKETQRATEGGPTKTIRGRGKKADRYVTPLQFAEKLQARLSERPAGKRAQPANLFLRGKRIFYYGGDLNYACEQTRNRMNIIIRHGGTLVPKYDPTQITHIVTDTSASLLLRGIGLVKLSEIPQHIATVKWSWVVSGVNRAPIRRAAQRTGIGEAPDKGPGGDPVQGVEEDEHEYRVDNEYEHAAYSARLDAGRTPWGEAAKPKAGSEAQESEVGSKVQAGGSRRTGPAEQSRIADDISNISEFTQDFAPPRAVAATAPGEVLPSPPSSPCGPLAGPAHPPESEDAARATRAVHPPALARGSAAHDERGRPGSADPLADFYAAARAERDAEVGALRADDDDSDCGQPAGPGGAPGRGGRTGTKTKKGFACDDTGAQARVGVACPNQDVVDKLEELKAIHEAKGTPHDRLRVQCYVKAVASLRKYPQRIMSHGEAVKIRGVGEKTAEKIMEIIHTGELRRIGHERTPDVAVVNLFRGIYGVGQKTAYMWYSSGCRTLADIAARKGGIRLSAEQEIGLKFYTDINTRIPRAEVAEIHAKIKATALTIDPKLFIEIMGSYRRGEADCGDIDIMITRPTDDGKTHQGLLRRLLKELHRQNVVTEDLCLPDDWDDLELVYRGLCKRDAHGLRRRIDFLTVPWKSRGAASLYYTGDQIFNRSLRLKANKMGYSLNQRGLYAGVIRDPRDRRQKLDSGQIIASESEAEILQILGVPWQEPHERVRE